MYIMSYFFLFLKHLALYYDHDVTTNEVFILSGPRQNGNFVSCDIMSWSQNMYGTFKNVS